MRLIHAGKTIGGISNSLFNWKKVLSVLIGSAKGNVINDFGTMILICFYFNKEELLDFFVILNSIKWSRDEWLKT